MAAGANETTPIRGGELPFFAAPALAFLLVAVSFLAQGRIGLNLADEGYLWHNAIRVLSGDVPIRDFQSYDPGRYYWSALWMKLLGSDGIIVLRVSVALFQACALTVGLLLLRRVVVRPAPFVIAALVFLLWFFPRHKLFDLSLSIWALYVGTLLIERPTVWRHFAAGLFVGLAAVFGRNHGVYSFVALFGLATLAWIRLDRTQPLAKLLAWCAGVGAGYLPVLLMAATQPGFLGAMVDSVLAIFRTGTNLAIPVPWPWAIDYRVPWPWAMHRLVVGMTFVAMPVLYLLGTIFVLLEKRPEAIRRNSVFVASIAVGMVYMHYAFSRADVGHLAHAIYPFLFALLSLPLVQKHPVRWWPALILPLALLGYSVFAAAFNSPLYATLNNKNFIALDVRGATLTVDPGTASAVRAAQSIAQNHMRPGDQIVFAPYWPTMYAVLGRRAPVWETYSVFPDDLQGQRRFTDELERGHVEWAVVGNALLDGREDRRFSSTHPMIWRYLGDHYEHVEIEGLPPDYRLLRRR